MLIFKQRVSGEVLGAGKQKSGFQLLCGGRAAQVSIGTSSSDVASSDRGMSSTSSSEEEDEEEEDEEKEGEADRGRELVEEEEGEALKREMLRPSVWKMEAREGLLGGAAATGGPCGLSGGGAGGA